MSNRSSLELSTRTVKIYSGAADAQARANIAEHVADNENPHEVTAEQVGLGNVDNTADAAKPVSTPQAAALAAKAPILSPALSGVPTAPTAALGSVGDQVATLSFVQAAITAVDVPAVSDELAAHIADTANPHQVEAADVGLGAVDNTADTSKPVSGPQQAAINAAAAIGAAAQADIDGHQANTGNPHATTKAQVGLGNVSNLAPADLPISTATQTAINAAAAIGAAAQADIDEHLLDTSNPHAVDANDVGLGNVDNTADAAKPVSASQQTAINVAAAIGNAAQADIDGHQADVSNPHSTTKAQVGLGAVDNTADLAKPVSTAQQAAINVAGNAATAAQADVDAHQANVSNPHTVTKLQVGLGNVANLAPPDLPISNATQTALNLKAPLLSPPLSGTPTAPTPPPLTNSTRLATTAYADAAVGLLTAEVDAAGDSAAAAQEDATQALADAAAAQADADSALAAAAALETLLLPVDAAFCPERPGDAVALYGTLDTGIPAAIPRVDPAWVVVSAAGSVIRVGLVPSEPVVPAEPDPALPVHVITPASGAIVVLTDLRPVYVDTGPLAALTIRLPAAVAPAAVEISFAAPVTSLDIQNDSAVPVPDSPSNAYGPGAALIFQYVDDTRGWVPWK